MLAFVGRQAGREANRAREVVGVCRRPMAWDDAVDASGGSSDKATPRTLYPGHVRYCCISHASGRQQTFETLRCRVRRRIVKKNLLRASPKLLRPRLPGSLNPNAGEDGLWAV